MNVYETISLLCKENGITEFGITTAQPFESLAERLAGFSMPGFCETDVKKRIYPYLTMETAKNIICLLFPYKPRPIGADDNFSAGKRQGSIVSGDVWLGMDYHIYVKNVLEIICARLEEKFSGSYMPFCDTGPFVDKEISVRSGLCEYGRNSLALNESYGSYFFIGYILTNLEIENAVVKEIRNFSKLCDGCLKCVEACPTGAISIDKPFIHSKCISYISQKKGALTKEDACRLGNTLYGCHKCQRVCPANKDGGFVLYADIEEEISISNKEFSEKFGNMAMRFIGKSTFVRNARAIWENFNKRG